MATNESNAIQGKNVHVTEAGFIHTAATQQYQSPSSDGTLALDTVVPADGAELIACSFTVTSAGAGTHTQEWSLGDGTRALATLAATTSTEAVGTVRTLTTTTATNGKALATTTGARLVLTNTSVGTSTQGPNGIFRLVWGV